MKVFRAFLVTQLYIFNSCGDDSSPIPSHRVVTDEKPSGLLETYYQTMTELKVEVYFEEGAEPYTGTSVSGRDYWSLLETNIGSFLDSQR